MDGDFRIGDWLVQPQIGTLTKGEQTVSLEPKLMDVLVYLTQHPDEVLPKERFSRENCNRPLINFQSDGLILHQIVFT